MPARCCSDGRTDAKYKRVPRDVRLLANFQMTDAEWDGLLIPINLAFFFQSSRDTQVSALYPSPAGATESLLPLEAWSSIVQANPVAERNGTGRGGSAGEPRRTLRVAWLAAEYYIAPIDACYRLVGLIRMHWRGLSGGTEVWQEIGKFLHRAPSHRQRSITEGVHA